MVVTTDIYEGAFCKVNGFPIGKVVSHDGVPVIEIRGEDDRIQKCIYDFHAGYGVNNVKLFCKEMGFIIYLLKHN